MNCPALLLRPNSNCGKRNPEWRPGLIGNTQKGSASRGTFSM